MDPMLQLGILVHHCFPQDGRLWRWSGQRLYYRQAEAVPCREASWLATVCKQIREIRTSSDFASGYSIDRRDSKCICWMKDLLLRSRPSCESRYQRSRARLSSHTMSLAWSYWSSHHLRELWTQTRLVECLQHRGWMVLMIEDQMLRLLLCILRLFR